jgi:subtilase-type serine protease
MHFFESSTSRSGTRTAALAAMFLAGVSALTLAPAHVGAAERTPIAAQTSEQAELSKRLAEAMALASRYGQRSVIASIIENVRLAPEHAALIESAAVAHSTLAGETIGKAKDVGLAMAAASAGTALPPGADPAVPVSELSEEEANFGWLMSGADAADRMGLTGKGVTVGVVDSGIARRLDGSAHPEFEDRIDPRSTSYFYWIDPTVTPEDFQRDPKGALQKLFDQETVNGFDDVDGHGTHVAGIIAAARDGKGMVGVAPGANILSINTIPANGSFGPLPLIALQVCGPSFLTSNGVDCAPKLPTEQYVAEAIRYLTTQSDVRITNGSFGPSPQPGEATVNVGVEKPSFDALSDYVMSGKIWVAAAGNGFDIAPIESESPDGLGIAPFISPENLGITNSIGAPVFDDGGLGLDYSHLHPDQLAALEAATGEAYGRIVTVVAVGAQKQISMFSNRCGVAARWCIAAPGGDFVEDADGKPTERSIFSAIPQNIADTNPAFPNGDAPPYGFKAGTSMAAPHVAGALAVLVEAYPGFTPGRIVEIMFQTAEDLGAPGIDEIFGHGLLRLDQALQGPIGLTGDSSELYQANVDDTHLWRFSFASDGALLKTGQGLLTTAADTTISFGQEAAIIEGGLQVDGRFAAPRLFVGPGALLGGSGFIQSDVGVAGTIAPGSSPGTLTVSGTVGLLDSATTAIEIDGAGTGNGAGNFDRIIALGAFDAFTAAGTLAPQLRGITGPATNSFVPALGETFRFVETPNGVVAGSFASLTQPTDGLPAGSRFDVLYGQQTLSLVATPSDYGTALAAGAAGNQVAARSVGAALQAIRPAAGTRPSAEAAAIFDPLYRLGANAVPIALSGAAGTIHVDVAQESLSSIGRFSDVLATRHTSLTSEGAATGTVWATPFLGGVQVSGNGEGFDADFRGFALGIEGSPDALFGNQASIGFASAYSTSSLDDWTGTADIDVVQGGIYGSYDWSGVIVSGAAGLSYASGDTRRAGILGVAESSFRGFGGFADLAVSKPYTFDIGTVEPFAAIGYRALDRRGFSEAGAFALDIAGKTYGQTFATAGIALSHSFELGSVTLEPQARLAYRFDFDRVDASGTASILGASFEAAGADIGRHAFVGSFGVEAALSDTVSLSAAYETEVRSDFASHGARVNLIARW